MRKGMLPSVLIERTVLYRADTVLPAVSRRKIGSFHDAASRETEKSWPEVIKSLGKILSETVFVSHPCIHREKGNMLHVNRSM